MKKNLLIFCILLSGITFNNAIAQINYQWAKGIGTSNSDKANSVAVDRLGNVYTTGFFGNGTADFNPYGTNSSSLTCSFGLDCFFAKYDMSGNCIWAKNLNATATGGGSYGTSIAVDTLGNVYITGFFLGTVDFNPSSTVFSFVSSSGDLDGFFAKYDMNGDFVWVKRIGGSGKDIVNSIALDPSGFVYVTGMFTGLGCTPDGGTALTNAGLEDIFFAKYGSDGSFLWAKSAGGADLDAATSIAIDGSGNFYITGAFRGQAKFNPQGSINDFTSAGAEDIFFAKYDSTGNFLWAKSVGSVGKDGGSAITLDTADNIYLTGAFRGTADFSLGSGSTIPVSGFQSAFYAKYTNNGTYLWANKIGGLSPLDSAAGTSIAVDRVGNVYLTGFFKGDADFDIAGGGDVHSSSTNGADIFFAKYDTTGSYNWAKNLSVGDKDAGTGIAVDTIGNIFLTGNYQSTVDFDPFAGIANRTSVGDDDIFLVKYREGTSTIKGHVTRISNGDAISVGYNNYVSLYAQTVGDGNAAMHLVDTAIINSNGDYIFTELCADNYLVLAITGVDYFGVIPTYYGDVTHWDLATYITTLPNTIDTADIVMAEYLAITGDAKIGGRIVGENGFDRTVKPIAGTEVGLEHDPGSIIVAHTVTDEEGYYSFENLSADTCYKVYVNIPGLPIVSNYHACPQSSDSIMTLDFVADSVSIDTVPGVMNSVLQMASYKTKILLYPNPYKGFTTITFTMAQSNWVHIEVYNLLGEKMVELLNEHKQAGIFKCDFKASDKGLSAGIYLINLKVGDEMITKKIIQIE